MCKDGDIAYRFTDGKHIKTQYVSARLQSQLVNGVLAIVKFPADGDAVYALVPRAVASKIAERDETLVVALNDPAAEQVDEDDPYADFKVPDDLMW